MTDRIERRCWLVKDMAYDGGPSTKLHYTREHADAEARRLSQQHPGRTFGVFKAVAAFRAAVGDVAELEVKTQKGPPF